MTDSEAAAIPTHLPGLLRMAGRHILQTVRTRTKLLPIVALVVLAACGVLGVPRHSVPPAPIPGAPDWERFKLYTHCGIDFGTIGFANEHWEATGPGPLNDGSGNPPDGFGNPWDEGWIVRLGPNDARYVSSQGVPLHLHRIEEPELDDGQMCM